MKKIFLILLIFCLIHSVSAAHYIVGNVNNALEGESANGKQIVLWNSANGRQDNLTDIVGPAGNSNTDNIYMIDCELLDSECKVGDELTIRLLYDQQEVNVTVTGAGYDVAPNLTLNSNPNITSIFVEDSILFPPGEIDLIAASTRTVICEAVVEELDGNSLENYFSEFYYDYQGAADNPYLHYTNNTCSINTSYGNENQTQFLCSYEVWYYAKPGTWECFFSTQDSLSFSGNSTSTTEINTLLSVGVQNTLNYTASGIEKISEEAELEVTNYGNVMINLSLTSYGNIEGDGLAMECSTGNISAEHQKYNLTNSHPGDIELVEAESLYSNMSEKTAIKIFNLDSKTTEQEPVNFTYWRIYAPSTINGECSGYLIFGASQDPGT